MCGRYTLIMLADIQRLFPWLSKSPDHGGARYNIAPSQSVAAITDGDPGHLQSLHWGFIPHWAKDPAIGNRMINARAETLAEKPAFRDAFRSRHCVIPADGFYEWRRDAAGAKTPMHIRLKSGKCFGFAGLWEDWHDDDGHAIRSCTIITTRANALLKDIHDRMPVILRESDWSRWLGPSTDPAKDFADILAPFPADEMEAYPVSPAVNSPSRDVPNLVERVEPFPTSLF